MKSLRNIAIIPSILGICSVFVLFSIYPNGVISQLFFFIVGMGTFFYVSRLPFSFWKAVALPFYVFVIGLLLVTLVVGKTTKGSSRWLVIGPLHFQPSQLAVPAIALFLVTFTQSYSMKSLVNVSKFAVLAAIPLVLIFLQPDLGTATVFFVISVAIYFFSGVGWKELVGSALIFIVICAIGWNFVLHDYQRDRIFSFRNPEEGTLSTAYNADQAKNAVGSGKVFGRGFGHGVLSALRFLPERQTDFFFASFAEEFGFVGSFMLLVLYLVFFLQLLLKTRDMQGVFGKLLGVALLSMFIWQTTVNIGMNVGLLPITGITLPFLSYGGSSVVSLFLFLAILESVSRVGKKERFIEFRSFV